MRVVLVAAIVALNVPVVSAQKQHPLDPLSASEIAKTVNVLRETGRLTTGTRFGTITVQPTSKTAPAPRAEIVAPYGDSSVSTWYPRDEGDYGMTIDNYDYQLNWIFSQDGAIEGEVILSGIMNVSGGRSRDSAQVEGHATSGHLAAPKSTRPIISISSAIVWTSMSTARRTPCTKPSPTRSRAIQKGAVRDGRKPAAQ
jgi:Cu2+-containing amine oxidase